MGHARQGHMGKHGGHQVVVRGSLWVLWEGSEEAGRGLAALDTLAGLCVGVCSPVGRQCQSNRGGSWVRAHNWLVCL